MASKNPDAPIDRVSMVTRNPDGTPKGQSETFEIIGDKEFAVRAAAEQLGQQAVSNEDHARARKQAAEAAGTATPSLSPEEEERSKRHKELMSNAAKQAATEIEGAHSGEEPAAPPLERSVPVETATTRTTRRASS